jgi:hypothetical protein
MGTFSQLMRYLSHQINGNGNTMIGSLKKITVVALAAATLMTGFVPSQAMQMPSAPMMEKSSDVQNVQYRRYRYGRPGMGYYGGYRGYPSYRRGYRHYNGYWYPLAAFGAGAIIGGAIASQPRYVRPSGGINPNHVAWCENRYRSYRAYDNTFQPYNAPRQQCYSPYY